LKKGRLDPFTLNYTWKGNSHDTIPIHLLEQALKHNILNRTINEQQPDQFPYWQLMWRLYHTRDTSQANTIAINMERWRWEKKPDEDYFIWINIPSYTLQLFECDTLALQSRVIVGKPETGTPPRLDSKIVYFWIYPYWMVPLSIATKEILPVLKRDTSYLRRHNMELLNGQNKVLNPNKIQWKNYSEDYFPFKIRQRDGDDNTLGILKFIFPNKLDIYLHDTNVRSLFRKSKRALSHGCIRIEKAKQLAERIITNSKLNYSIDSLHSDLKNKIRKKVSLSTPISIHIRYFTCEANSNGIIFYEDVYGLDEKMKESLKNK
jgi:murein L,D-transpeptidase YcbB/YkuD